MPREVQNSMANTTQTNLPLLLFYEVSLRFSKKLSSPLNSTGPTRGRGQGIPFLPPRHTLLIELMLKAGSFINAEDASQKTGFRTNPVGKLVKRYPNNLNGTWDLNPNGPKMTAMELFWILRFFRGLFFGGSADRWRFLGWVGRVGSFGIWECFGPP